MYWGKSFWTTIHVAALGYPDNVTETKRQEYKTFYTTLGSVLPCEKCRKNYVLHLKELPIDFYLFDKHSLFGWTVKLHNIVNRSTGKKEWSVEEAKEFYTQHKYFKEDEKHTSKTLDALIILNACLCVFILFIIWKYLKRNS